MAELSEVIWHQIMSTALQHHEPFTQVVFLFIIFIIWAILSIAILVLMEGLSAFLHTLRLHW